MKKNILFLVALLMGLVINVNGVSAAEEIHFINDSSYNVLSLIYESPSEYGRNMGRKYEVDAGVPLKYQDKNQKLQPQEWDDSTNTWNSDHVTRNGFDYYAKRPLRPGEHLSEWRSYTDEPYRVIALLDNTRVLQTDYIHEPNCVAYYITDDGIECISLPDDDNARKMALEDILRRLTHRASEHDAN